MSAEFGDTAVPMAAGRSAFYGTALTRTGSVAGRKGCSRQQQMNPPGLPGDLAETVPEATDNTA